MPSSLVRALASVRGLRIGWHVAARVSGQPLLLLALLLRLGGHALVLGLYHLTRLCNNKMTGQHKQHFGVISGNCSNVHLRAPPTFAIAAAVVSDGGAFVAGAGTFLRGRARLTGQPLRQRGCF